MRAKKWLVAAGAVLLSSALVTGVAMAASNPETKVAQGRQEMGQKPNLDQMVQEGKITQGQADVMTQLQALRQKAMQQLKADSKAVIDQAVKDGKITQEQADTMAKRGMMWHRHGGGPGKQGFAPGQRGMAPGKGPKTEAELKAFLDEKVKAGKLTQEKADQMLKQWQSHRSEKASGQQG